MKTLYALDLLKPPAAEPLRTMAQTPLAKGTNRQPAFPVDDFISPQGFRFAVTPSEPTRAIPLRVEIFSPDESARPAGDGAPSRADGTVTRRMSRATLKLAKTEDRPTAARSLLALEIDATTARVEVDAEVWPSIAETVLLLVAQCWRFHAIDRTLEELAEWARGDLSSGSLLPLIRPRRGRELRAGRRKLQALILDLPDSESLLTNPRAHLAGGRPLRLFRALAKQLGLPRWRRTIDERVEVVEAVFDSLAESLDHVQALALQVVLEVAIVIVLVVDVGLFLLEQFAR
jgi:hypothetical protein